MMSTLDKVRIRPVIENDWQVILSWLEHDNRENINPLIFKLRQYMKHSGTIVAVDETGKGQF